MQIKYIKCVPFLNYYKVQMVVEGGSEEELASLNQEDYDVFFKKRTKQRTLTANAYYQVLLDKLTAKLKANRDELHEELLKRYGVTLTNHDKPVLFAILKEIDPHSFVKYVERIGEKENEGKTLICYRALKPSSEMNREEFANLLDGLIGECNELGIETLTEKEKEMLKW